MTSKDNPHYRVTVLNSSGNKYEITGALKELVLDEQENGIAQRVKLTIMQAKHDGKYLTSLINVHDRLYVYANTGSGSKEVFRGYVWKDVYEKSDTKEITLTAYDRLIYLKETEEYKFYSSGKSTKSIFQDICNAKGIKLKYNHSSIKHGKLVIKGSLADAFDSDLLEEVRKKTGKRGVIRSTQGNLEVFTEGKGNSTIYKLYHGTNGNLLKTKHTVSLDGITTKVTIMGYAKTDTKAPIKATVKGNTSKYGTIQKTIYASESDKLADLKKEANQIIKDDGKPKTEVSAVAVDNPWIRKGDTVYLDDGYKAGYAYVKSIEHDAQNKIMSMELRMA